jgi:hypothetical protein
MFVCRFLHISLLFLFFSLSLFSSRRSDSAGVCVRVIRSRIEEASQEECAESESENERVIDAKSNLVE